MYACKSNVLFVPLTFAKARSFVASMFDQQTAWDKFQYTDEYVHYILGLIPFLKEEEAAMGKDRVSQLQQEVGNLSYFDSYMNSFTSAHLLKYI